VPSECNDESLDVRTEELARLTPTQVVEHLRQVIPERKCNVRHLGNYDTNHTYKRKCNNVRHNFKLIINKQHLQR